MKIYLISIFIISSLLCCHEKYGKKQEIISEVNNIISQVAAFSAIELTNGNFLMATERNAQVLFFGERHTSVAGQIRNLGAINLLSKKGDIILLEGADRKVDINMDCADYLIYKIYTNKLYQEYVKSHGIEYRLNGAHDLALQNNLLSLFMANVGLFETNKLSLKGLSCAFWDDQEVLLRGQVSYAALKRRNSSQIRAISDALKTHPRVIVSAGYAHMPLGEMVNLIRLNDRGKIPIFNNYDEMYNALEKQRFLSHQYRSFVIAEYAGSSRILYRYLSANKVSFSQYIPLNMF